MNRSKVLYEIFSAIILRAFSSFSASRLAASDVWILSSIKQITMKIRNDISVKKAPKSSSSISGTFIFLKFLCANGTLSSDLVYGSDGLANDYKGRTQSRAVANYPLNNLCKHYFCPARVVVKIPLLHTGTPLHSGTY